MMATYCPTCGKNLALVGRAHNCTPRAGVVAEAKAGGAVAKPEKPVAKPAVEAVAPVAKHYSGRYRDVEKRKAYMRTYMRDFMRQNRAG